MNVVWSFSLRMIAAVSRSKNQAEKGHILGAHVKRDGRPLPSSQLVDVSFLMSVFILKQKRWRKHLLHLLAITICPNGPYHLCYGDSWVKLEIEMRHRSFCLQNGKALWAKRIQDGSGSETKSRWKKCELLKHLPLEKYLCLMSITTTCLAFLLAL